MDNAHLIVNNLFLGNIQAANDKIFITNNDIKLVIHCTKDFDIPNWYENVHVIRLPINDSNTDQDNELLYNNIDGIIETIHQYRLKKQNVFVHCYAGISRSATVVCCYLMKYYTIKLYLAMIFIKNKRPIAFINNPPVFLDFLENYYRRIE
jgi:protein-tyrosine phosphatase